MNKEEVVKILYKKTISRNTEEAIKHGIPAEQVEQLVKQAGESIVEHLNMIYDTLDEHNLIVK